MTVFFARTVLLHTILLYPDLETAFTDILESDSAILSRETRLACVLFSETPESRKKVG